MTVKKLWLGLAMSSALLLAACGDENETASEMSEAVEVINEYAEIDERMHEYAITQLVGANDYLEGLFYEGDMERFKKRMPYYSLPSSFEDFKYYFQMLNVGNNYEILRTNLYEPKGFLLYVVRYHNEADEKKYASPFLVEKIDGKWVIRYDLNRSFSSPHFESNFKSGKLTGSGIVRLIDVYPEFATEVISKEQTENYFETLTDVKREEIQQHIDSRNAYYD